MARIVNQTRGTILASCAVVAATWRARMVGLLDRQALEEGQALILPRCCTIHTIGMRFAIDVLFVRKGVVVRAIRTLAPFRLVWALGADTVIELPAGTLARTSTTLGAQVGPI